MNKLGNNSSKRKEKEKLLNQKAKVIWLTGLSGAGKTTIALELEKELSKRGYLTQLLDGDILRDGLNKDLSFTEDNRIENIRRVAEVSRLFIDCGIICINSFISPTHAIRNMSKEIIGKKDFIEVFVNAPLHVCEERDVKGLYKKARKGEILHFTGIDAPYEIPENADLELRTDELSVGEAVDECLRIVLEKVEYGIN